MKIEVQDLSRFPWAARAELARFRERAVPIADLTVLELSGGPSVPTCVLDSRNYPNVAEAIKRRSGELAELPDCGYQLDVLACTDDVLFALYLRLGRRRWSRVKFKVILSCRQHRQWLDTVALANQLTLSCRNVQTAGEALEAGLTFQIDGADLAHALRLADASRGLVAANSVGGG